MEPDNELDFDELRPRIEVFVSNSKGRLFHNRKYLCRLCPNVSFSSFQAFDKHQVWSHVCPKCLCCFSKLKLHLVICEKNKQIGGQITPQVNAPLLPPHLLNGLHKLELTNSVFYGTIVTFNYKYRSIVEGLNQGISIIHADLVYLLKELLKTWKGLRVAINFECLMENLDSTVSKPRILFAPFQRIISPHSVESKIRIALTSLNVLLHIFSDFSSGFHLSRVIGVEIRLAQFAPLLPAKSIPTPNTITKRYTINIETDICCFIYSILSIIKREEIIQNLFGKGEFLLTKNEKRKLAKFLTKPSTYLPVLERIHSSGEFNFDGFMGIVAIEDIEKFTLQTGISVFVLGEENGSFFPMHICKEMLPLHADLILIKQAINESNNNIISPNVQFNSHYISAYPNATYVLRVQNKGSRKSLCHYCVRLFSNIEDHVDQCAVLHQAKIRFPSAERYKSFQMYSKLDIGYKIFYTFSCKRVLNTTDDEVNKIDPTQLSYTNALSNCTWFSYTIVVINPFGNLEYIEYYDKSLVAENFFKTLIYLCEKYETLVKEIPYKLEVGPADRERWNNATVCELCLKPFTDSDIKIFHHNHLRPGGLIMENSTGHSINILHNRCNLLLRVRPVVIISYNNSEVENRILLASLRPEIITSVQAIGQENKLIMLKLNKKFKILDLQLFVHADLWLAVSKIKNYVSKEELPSKFPTLYNYYHGNEYTELLLERLTFPFRWFTNETLLNQTQFPEHSSFHDDAYNDLILEKEYSHSKYVYNTFGMKNMQQYLELFCKVQTLLIADVALLFNMFCEKNFYYYPFHFVSLTSFAFFIGNEMSPEKFEFCKNLQWTQLMRENCPSGIISICHRFAKSNNSECGKFNQNKPISYILNLDCNSMFNFILSNFKMPISNYTEIADVASFDISMLNNDSEWGYLLLVDVSTPRYLEKYTDLLPFFAQRDFIKQEDLSPIQRKMLDEIGEDITDPFAKNRIILSHHKKTNYLVYYKLLLFFLRMGAKIDKIKRVFKFRQTNWTKPFADKLSDIRLRAKSEKTNFEEGLSKAMYCLFYGKSLCNTQNYKQLKVVMTRTEALRYVSRDTFSGLTILSEHVALLEMRKRTALQSNPLILGVVIASLSQLLYYKFVYSLLAKFPDMKYLIGDTDGLIVQLFSKDENEIWKKLSQMNLDMSRLPMSHKYRSTEFENKMGFFGIRNYKIIEAVALKPKFFSILIECNTCQRESNGACNFCEQMKRAKAVPRRLLYRLSHDYYKEALYNTGIKFIETRGTKGRHHDFGLYHKSRVGFYSLILDRYLCESLTETFAFGNSEINQIQNN